MTDDSKSTITPERWHRASEIFADALERDEGTARDAFLARTCGDDHALLQQVRALIAAEARSPDDLGLAQFAQVVASAADGAADGMVDSAEHWIGQRVGAYKIVSEIARGGMGLVFKGCRDDAEFNKDVAIKLVRGSGDQTRLIERFKAERQILATLDHPNIARLIDGGTTADGWPFLVMEFVDGEPITAYAARHSLDVNGRLDLFRSVCAAVHFAHQRLVVHRDLKPSNIFVNQQGEVKLLDFGIAKLLAAPAASETPDAATTLLAMTPAYASPEQIRNEPITTASDVYALGVVLYELLTGQSPYKAKKTQPLDLAKEICETDPERPSTVVGRADDDASTPHTSGIVAPDLKRLQRGLRGDLDNIVMMALRKDPARRYASAEQLSEDIRRYQQDQPVIARADTFTYRASKFVSRNRWAIGFAALAGVGMIVGIVATTYQANVARQAQAKAEWHFTDIRQISNTMLFELFDEIREVPGTLKAQQSLLKKATEYLDRLAGDAVDNPDLLAEAGVGFGKLAQLYSDVLIQEQTADQYSRRSLSLLEKAFAAKPESATIALSLTRAYIRQGQLLDALQKDKEGEAMLEKAIAFSAALPPPLQTVDQKLARGRAWFALNATTALLNLSDRRIVVLTNARSIFDEIQQDSAATPQTDEAQRLSLLTSVSLAGAEMGKPNGAGLNAAYEAIQRAVAGYAERVRTGKPGSAVVRDKKALAYAHMRLATVLERLGRGAERLDSLRLAERYGAELVEADPADMHAQLLRLSANTSMLEALYDETQIGPIVPLATEALARLDQLPDQVREQIQGKNIRGSLLVTLGRAQASMAEREQQTDASRLSYWRDALKNLSAGLEVQMSIKQLFQDEEAKAFDETRKVIARAEAEVSRLAPSQSR